jgi:hypothetical protein
VTGKAISLTPERLNILFCSAIESTDAMDITDNTTMRVFITPRWSLL